jgi:hypothetical protein
MEKLPGQEQIIDLVPIPKESLEIDQEKALRWVEAETNPDYQAIKRKIVENIQHVSFQEFKANAEKVIQEAIDELAKDNEKYALFFDYKPHSSKRWVAELNTDVIKQYPPTDAGYFTPTWERMSGNKRLGELRESESHTFLIVDDGAYSGEHVFQRQIEPVLNFYEAEGIEQMPKFIVAIPYVTNRFLKLMKDVETDRKCKIEVKYSVIMPSLNEILDQKEIETIQRQGGKLDTTFSEVTYLGATLTYFDHRVADGHSFSEEVKAVLQLSAPKPYADETCPYYEKEAREFEVYKQIVFKH